MRSNRSGRRTGAAIVLATSPAGCIGEAPPSPAGFITRAPQFGIIPRSADVFAVAPAGDLATGTPSNNQAAGSYRFRSNIQMLGVEPNVNAAAFQANLARTVGEIMASFAPVVNSARVVKGARQTQTVDRPGVGAAALRGVPGSSIVGAGRRDVPTWWVTIEGQITAPYAWQLNGAAGFNRAIARAFAQSSTFSSVDSAYPAPPDGGPLDNAFRRDGACAGTRDFNAVFAAACTRVEPAAAAPSPTAAPAPRQGGPVMTPIPAPSGPASGSGPTCPIRVQSPMWLRPTATFDRTGPQFPAGTAVTVTGPKVQERGTLALYPVTVGTQRGFAALSAEDFLGCTAFPGPPRGASGGSGGSAPAAPQPAPLLAPPPPREDEGVSPLVIGGVAAGVTVAGVLAYVNRAKIKSMFSRRKSNAAPRRRRRRARR